MIPPFRTIPAQNTYRLMHVTENTHARDLDRIEDLLANGIGAARGALRALEDLPHETYRPLDRWIRALAEHVGRRRLLTAQFLTDASELARRLEEAKPVAPEDKVHGAALSYLREAIALADRVSDLLAAETDIGWHRTLRD